MIGIKFFLFGYLPIAVDARERSIVAHRLFSHSIPMKSLKNGCIAVLEKHRKEVLSLCPFLASKALKRKGLPEIIYGNRKRYGVFSALFICFFLLLFSMGRVWDIRVLGASETAVEQVRAVLKSEGIETGARFRSFDFSETENRLKDLCPSVAWVNAHRRGTVLYLNVVESEAGRQESVPPLCNIVASEDAVIVSISPSAGVAMVKTGDAVKKGDLLISAVHPDGTVSGAAGEVIGLVNGSASVFCAKEETRSISERIKTVSVKIRILNFSAFILKNYGNLPKEYVIIKGEKQMRLFGRVSLPLFLSVDTAYAARKEAVHYSDADTVRIAGLRMKAALSELLSAGALESIRTEGEFTDEGYGLRAEYVQRRQICESVPIRLVGEG